MKGIEYACHFETSNLSSFLDVRHQHAHTLCYIALCHIILYHIIRYDIIYDMTLYMRKYRQLFVGAHRHLPVVNGRSHNAECIRLDDRHLGKVEVGEEEEEGLFKADAVNEEEGCWVWWRKRNSSGGMEEEGVGEDDLWIWNKELCIVRSHCHSGSGPLVNKTFY